MKPKSLRVLVRTGQTTKLLFKLKELPNGDILYSFGALDGRPRPRLYGETHHKIEPGPKRYKYEDVQLVLGAVDHFSLHASGYHVVTSPRVKTERAKHWGIIIQPKLQVPFEWRNFGIILPAALERFPDHVQQFDPTRDTQIDLTVLKVPWVYFELGIIGRKLERDKPGFFGVPPGMVNVSATNVAECFTGALTWFLLPLTSYTMLVLLKTQPGDPLPPRTAFVRWKSEEPATAHVAYLE